LTDNNNNNNKKITQSKHLIDTGRKHLITFVTNGRRHCINFVNFKRDKLKIYNGKENLNTSFDTVR
jgi:hypothetical protein